MHVKKFIVIGADHACLGAAHIVQGRGGNLIAHVQRRNEGFPIIFPCALDFPALGFIGAGVVAGLIVGFFHGQLFQGLVVAGVFHRNAGIREHNGPAVGLQTSQQRFHQADGLLLLGGTGVDHQDALMDGIKRARFRRPGQGKQFAAAV